MNLKEVKKAAPALLRHLAEGVLRDMTRIWNGVCFGTGLTIGFVLVLKMFM